MKPCYQLLLTLTLLLGAAAGAAQRSTVTGTVTDAATNETLIGVNILVKGTSTGTITDVDGTYSISVLPTDTLEFSYTGFQTRDEAVAGRAVIDLPLATDAEILNEVVVVGYGVQRKSDLTGAVSSVSGEELTRIATPSVSQAIQGKIAGVLVTPASGQPGAEAIIRIRGTGTLNDASPLFVVDGMLLDDIGFLNPNDVETVTVLKDASATAIYGSRGANGVIIVTTKGGTSGKTIFNVDSYYGTQEVVRKIDLVDADQFATLANELAVNENIGRPFPETTDFGAGTDWQDVIFQHAPIQSHQLSARGGSDALTFYLSANYFQQEGIVRGSEFKRLTLRLNNEYRLTDNVRLGHNISLIRTDSEFPAGVVTNAYRADPTVPAVDSLGNFGNTSIRASVGNPAAQIEFNNNSGFGTRAVGNIYVDATILKNFNFRTSFGLDQSQNQSKNFVPEFFVSSIQQNLESNLSVNLNRNQTWLWENTLTYSREWNRHRVNILGGITAQDNSSEFFGGSRVGIPGDTDELFFLNAGEVDGQTNFNGGDVSNLLSYLFRSNYTFNDRLLITLSMRADGSSKFGPNNRWGYFPSAAVGYNFSQDAFLESIPGLSRLKIRGSWGQTGNEKIGTFRYLPLVTSNLNAVFGNPETFNFGAGIITRANPDIKWEETTQTDLGLELGFIGNRLTLEVDYYRRVTSGILIDVPIPDFIGSANNPTVNAAEVLNRGFDFDLNWRDTRNDFSYNFGIVASTVYNEVLGLGQGNEDIIGGNVGVNAQNATRTLIGLPIGAFYGYQTNGVFQNPAEIADSPTLGAQVPGDLRFVDTDGDGTITTQDRTYLGSPIPDFIYGFTLGAAYKGIDFSIDFNGVSGNKIINAKKIARFGTYNFETSFLDRWNGEGTSNSEPRITNGGVNYNVSDRFIEDGSFMRLRNLQIGYTLPQQLTRRLSISRLRIYANGTNLVTWSDYSGYTPEISSGSVINVGIDDGIYPIARTITGGINITF